MIKELVIFVCLLSIGIAGIYVVDVLPERMTVLDYMSNHREDLGNCMNLVRGIRDAGDAIEEIRLSEQYRWFSHKIGFEFIPLIARPELRSVSSSLVREMLKYTASEDLPVPEEIRKVLEEHV